MNVERLKEFLCGKVEAKKFGDEIQDEVRDHVEKLLKLGASAPVYVDGEASLRIRREHLGRICESYAHEKLTKKQVAYIADAILMYEGFLIDDDQIENLLFELSDEDLNMPLTPRRILEINKQLG